MYNYVPFVKNKGVERLNALPLCQTFPYFRDYDNFKKRDMDYATKNQRRKIMVITYLKFN